MAVPKRKEEQIKIFGLIPIFFIVYFDLLYFCDIIMINLVFAKNKINLKY